MGVGGDRFFRAFEQGGVHGVEADEGGEETDLFGRGGWVGGWMLGGEKR